MISQFCNFLVFVLLQLSVSHADNSILSTILENNLGLHDGSLVTGYGIGSNYCFLEIIKLPIKSNATKSSAQYLVRWTREQSLDRPEVYLEDPINAVPENSPPGTCFDKQYKSLLYGTGCWDTQPIYMKDILDLRLNNRTISVANVVLDSSTIRYTDFDYDQFFHITQYINRDQTGAATGKYPWGETCVLKFTP
ncbi:MAG: hypothetical protein H6623_00720 [Bdellovibrionaceae bacterium]|nr:hypothetical protein [Pseudobdellovibrionaceae bacterium]